MPVATRVFDGDRLRADLWLPKTTATALYVTFRQRIPDPGSFTEAGPVGGALNAGLAHIRIQSRWNDWFLNDETTALEAALSALRPRFATALALGYSMGGYAAMRLARALDLDQAILVSPQFTLDRSVLPAERRYPEGKDFDGRLGNLAAHGKPDLAGIVIFDPFRPLDRMHAALVTGAMPAIARAPLPFGGHPATNALGERGGFRTLQALSLAPGASAADVVGLHRGLRSGSARYWRNRAEACRKAGKVRAAELATTRSVALSS
jgi:pimeloyl-ACP methyl ester carboxylesterase